MKKFDEFALKPIIITFKTPNGEMWDESYTMRLYDLFIKDPTVYEIRNKLTDEILYRRKDD